MSAEKIPLYICGFAFDSAGLTYTSVSEDKYFFLTHTLHVVNLGGCDVLDSAVVVFFSAIFCRIEMITVKMFVVPSSRSLQREVDEVESYQPSLLSLCA